MKRKPKLLNWRDGRPRWEPSPTLRELGFKGMDLKDDAGKWMDWSAACALADQLNLRADQARQASGHRTIEERIAAAAAGVALRPERRFRAGYVYFFWVGESIKIGFSTKPFGRLNSLMTSASEKPSKVVVLPGTLADEKRLHRRFEKHRSHLEWFRSSKQLNDLINEMTIAGTTNIP